MVAVDWLTEQLSFLQEVKDSAHSVLWWWLAGTQTALRQPVP